jgi:hypothetical protein
MAVVPPFPSVAVGVGNHPQSGSVMLKSTGVCANNSPPRIEPQLGKVSKHSSESSNNKRWGVFHEDVARFHFANDSGHVLPHAAAVSFDSGAFAGDADVLAWKPARYDVNNASPWSAVKGLHVIPDGKRVQAAVVLSLHKNACGVGVPFDGAYGSPAKEFSPKDAATSACE